VEFHRSTLSQHHIQSVFLEISKAMKRANSRYLLHGEFSGRTPISERPFLWICNRRLCSPNFPYKMR
jgi:hypothetical protein